jgi:hypothetical protein
MAERVAERFRWAVETLAPAPSDRLLEVFAVNVRLFRRQKCSGAC